MFNPHRTLSPCIPGISCLYRRPHLICLRMQSLFASSPNAFPCSLSCASRLVSHAATTPLHWQPRRHHAQVRPGGLATGQWRGAAAQYRATRCRHGHHPNLILPLFMYPGPCWAAAAAGRGCLVGRLCGWASLTPRLDPCEPGLSPLHHVNCFSPPALAIAVPDCLPLTGPLGEARK